MTLRRLRLLLRALPPDSWFWSEQVEAQKRADEQAKVDHIRARTEFYARRQLDSEEGS